MPTIDNWRSTLMRAAIDCPEHISDDALFVTSRDDLKQLADRLAEAVKPLLDERDRLATDAQNCKELIWALARELKCLPSTFSDANGHVLKAAIALNAERDRLAAEVEALRADAGQADSLVMKIFDRFLLCYRMKPAEVATACDEKIDRSGGLLGWIREASRRQPQDAAMKGKP